MSAIGMLRVSHVMMKMYDALWPARSSRRIHPESHVTSACVGTVEIGRHALKKLFVANLARCFSTTIYDDNLLHSACRHNVIGEGNMQIRLAQNEPCLSIGQKICERLGVGLGVKQHRYQPGAYRAEKGGWIGWRIVQKERDAVPAAKPEPQEGVAPLCRRGDKLGIGQTCLLYTSPSPRDEL